MLSNNADIAGTIEFIKECLKLCHSVVRAPHAYIIRKTIIVLTYGKDQVYTNPYNKIITSILHLTPDKNKLHNEQSAPSVKEHAAEYEIGNRSVYDILDQS